METQDLFVKFGQPQRLPRSSLRSSQRVGSLSTLILPSCHQGQLVFTINLHEEEGNTNSSVLNHNPWELLGDT
jgi:hypothetical protein